MSDTSQGDFDPTSPQFPPLPPDTGLTYVSYLKVDELLALQRPLSEPPHHDEFLFIVIHQVYELWFRQLLHELDGAVAALGQGRILAVHKIFRRVGAITKVLISQLAVLETMTPQDFNVFRKHLNPASGFQSAQFRELEALCGLKDPRFKKLHTASPETIARLERRLAEPSIYDAFLSALAARGFDVPTVAPAEDTPESERVLTAFKAIYEQSETHYDLYMACEYFIEFDEAIQLWRFGHVKMVERTIGHKRGTGGSSGARYLRTTLDKRFFPELWDVRSRIGNPTGSW